ncbi:RHS repeat-associated core domain-containing protein [Pokkaliibacter sp. CJK22405]|uniref:RHS repeat-associated core domain-containing protein n=1 Tax=Pokkaliibacter sp. CJK22405 TaxID=3384615 RepID=UPI0039855044
MRYFYDSLGRRIAKQVETRQLVREDGYDEEDDDAWVTRIDRATTVFFWDDQRLIGEVTDDQYRWYLYEPKTFRPLALVDQGQVYTYQLDQLGTPQRLCDLTGRTVWLASYSAFGEAHISLEEVSNPLRFQGQYFDAESGLHYNRYRYYDPQTGRYISQDPIGLLGGLNPYRYTPNPINWVDPLGLSANTPKPCKETIPEFCEMPTVDGIPLPECVSYSPPTDVTTWTHVKSSLRSFNDGLLNTLDALGPVGAEFGAAEQAVIWAGGKTITGVSKVLTAAEEGVVYLGNKVETGYNWVTSAAGKVTNKNVIDGLTELDPRFIRTTQTTTKQQGATLRALTESMQKNGFQVEPDKLIDIVRMPDGGLTSLDNTRIVAADLAGVKIQARVHNFDDLLPNDEQFISRFIGRKGEVPTNWGEAVKNRISNQSSLFRNPYPEGSPFISYGKKY